MKQIALRAARMYLALIRDPRGRIRDETRMLTRLQAHAVKIAKVYNARNPGECVTRDQVLDALDAEARRLGPIVPVLGKDL